MSKFGFVLVLMLSVIFLGVTTPSIATAQDRVATSIFWLNSQPGQRWDQLMHLSYPLKIGH